MADISKIKLPSGNEYDIKDAVARQMIAGGVSFNIVWTAADYASSSAPNATKLATIPAGVVVYYNNGANNATGTLAASTETIGKFYLIYSKTQAGTLDAFDEYVTVGESTKSWEKIGDTLIDLSGVVTNVTLNKSTDTVIGSDATFSITQPTIILSNDAIPDETGSIKINDFSADAINIKATASNANTAWNSKDSKTVLTGVKTNNTNIAATATGGGAAWNSKDSKTVLTGVKTNNTNVKATASGANVAWNSKDSVTVVTGVAASISNLGTTTIYGVGSTTTSASKATAASTQTTATGSGNTSTTNTDWLKGVSVSNEVLTIGAATMATQSTTQFTFSDVTVPVKNSSTTTVATGQLVASGGGATVATGVSASGTDTVIGTDATFTVTQPTVALASGATAGTGVISLAYGAAANGTASVIGNSATFTNTQPTVALSSGATAGNGVVSLAYGAAANGTASVIGGNATFTITQPTIALSSNGTGASGEVSVLTNLQQSAQWVKATASSGNVAWNNKDQVTVLTDSTSLTVTKGQ